MGTDAGDRIRNHLRPLIESDADRSYFDKLISECEQQARADLYWRVDSRVRSLVPSVASVQGDLRPHTWEVIGRDDVLRIIKEEVTR